MPEGTDGESGHEILMLQSAGSCNEKSQSHGVGCSRLHYSQTYHGAETLVFRECKRNLNFFRLNKVEKSYGTACQNSHILLWFDIPVSWREIIVQTCFPVAWTTWEGISPCRMLLVLRWVASPLCCLVMRITLHIYSPISIFPKCCNSLLTMLLCVELSYLLYFYLIWCSITHPNMT